MQFQEFDLDLAIQAYADYLVADYAKFAEKNLDQVFAEKNYAVQFENGRKYLKVCHVNRGGGRSAHSFIVKKADGKFQVGDILKAASWAAPANNFVRGNVISQKYGQINWAGC